MDLTAAVTAIFPEACLVGGALRDALLGRAFRDIDIAVPPSEDFQAKVRRLAAKLDAACVLLDEETRVFRLVQRCTPRAQLDVMPFVGGTLASDLKRRDFTVNAMALPLSRGMKFRSRAGAFSLKPDRRAVIDPHKGLKDLKSRKVRPVSPGVFTEDPVRLLRAFRIASALDFSITPDALKAIKKHSRLIKKSSPERCREELMRLLESPVSHKWLALMHGQGLLTALFPELAAQETCAASYYGKGGVMTHTLRVVERADTLFSDLPAWLPAHAKAGDRMPEPRLLKLAALLHDIAKPAKAAMIKGRLRFFGHEECGAAMAERAMEGLRFSRAEIQLVSRTIGAHLRPGNLAANDAISDRAMFRFFRAMGDYTIPLLVLSWADHASYVSSEQLRRMRRRLQAQPQPLPAGLPYNSPKKTLRYMQVLNLLFNAYVKRTLKMNRERLVDGNDVMRALKIKEGPRIGEILEKVQLLQFEGRIKTRDQALKTLKGMK